MTPPTVLVVDLQNDFLDANAGGRGKLCKGFGLPATRRLLKHARANRWPIIHIATVHEGPETIPIRLRGRSPVYCMRGSGGEGLIAGLRDEEELIIRKQQFSAFDGTDLTRILESTSSVVLAGIAADCCILHTAFDAAGQGKEVYIPYQAIGAAGPDEFLAGLVTLNKSAAFVGDLRDLLKSGQSALKESIPEADFRARLRAWFDGGAAALKKVEAGGPGAQAIPVDQAIRLLEQQLGEFCDT